MKPFKLLITLSLATMAILLMVGVVVAAPAGVTSARVAYTNEAPEPPLTDTLPTTHPVGIFIAIYFNIPYSQVMELHAAGFGFGTIARAYLTALESNWTLSPEQILEMRQTGTGWGEIKKDYGIRPGQNGLGIIMRSKPITPTVTLNPPDQGNKDKDKDKGNCPGNSCNAPGQNKPEKDKAPKPDVTKGPKK